MEKEYRIGRLDDGRILECLAAVDRLMAVDTQDDIPDLLLEHCALLNKHILVVMEVPKLFRHGSRSKAVPSGVSSTLLSL